MSISLNKILVSDPVDKTCVELLKKHNFDVTCKYGMSQDELIKEIKDYDALVVRSETKVKAEVLAAASKLRVVGRAGTGVDNIDTNAATRRGVIVLNTPGGNSISACELTCAFICSLSRNVAPGCQSLKEGRWDRKLYMGEELQGKTLAVLGLGRIGREVAHRMSAFGMNIIGFDPLVPPGTLPGVEILTLDEVWPRADYITVHTPLIPQTRNLVNDVTLSKCKKGVKVVNVARGGIIDEVALLTALQSGQCGGAALDVFSEEPPKSAQLLELIRHPKVLATPHLGASTAEAQVRVAEEIAEQLVALADPSSGYKVTGVVNSPGLSDLRDAVNAPWLSLGKALGTVAGKLGGLATSTSWKTVALELETHGDLTKPMGFLKTAALFGLMNLKLTREPLNLINAPLLAQEAGLTLKTKHNDDPEAQPLVSLTINDGNVNHTVSGTCRGGETWLLSIDDAPFTSGIPLNESTLIFKGTDAAEDCPLIIGELVKSGVAITNMAVANGKSAVWISVHTIDPIDKKLIIPKLKVF